LNKKDFERFYNGHFDKVYRFIFFRVGGNRDVAEDLVSEIFMKALKSFERYDEQISQSAWITTIAKNHLLNYWRDRKNTVPLPESEDSEDGFSNEAFWLKVATMSQQKQGTKWEIAEVLAKIDPESREIVTFHYLLGYSYAEIAKQKGMTEGAVKVAAHRAIKKMRDLV
jgi:RNA polymerase sigma-70 factor (ECF subfamily)